MVFSSREKCKFICYFFSDFCCFMLILDVLAKKRRRQTDGRTITNKRSLLCCSMSMMQKRRAHFPFPSKVQFLHGYLCSSVKSIQSSAICSMNEDIFLFSGKKEEIEHNERKRKSPKNRVTFQNAFVACKSVELQ